jgi:PiT family inorganic phosphate transporter
MVIFATATALSLGVGIGIVNGANDVSKGIATLVGSGVTDIRRALVWGSAWTGVGAISATVLAKAMVETFGKGLLGTHVHPTIAGALAAIAGAGLWVLLATQRGMPVSTTHAIIGSITGVAWMSYGASGVQWAVLGGKVLIPLLLSPPVAGLTTAIVMKAWNALAPNADCVCADLSQPVLTNPDGNLSVAVIPEVRLSTCAVPKENRTFVTVNHLHWLTSGATSFARGLNDAPKIAALVLGASALSGSSENQSALTFFAVAAGMVLGSIIAGRRVTSVLACDVVRMIPREGFVANLVTAALVGPGAALGIPMSTTHVSTGAIMGIGVSEKSANAKAIRNMLIAWLVTVPVAGLLGITVLAVFRITGLH